MRLAMLPKNYGNEEVNKMNNYIEKFESVKEIERCAEYYIELLGLQDWRIIFKLTDNFNPDWMGMCDSEHTAKVACISIRKTIDNLDLWCKQPQEEVLIHELLHCKFILPDDDTLSGVLIYQQGHTLLDDMARAIFKARYNLTNKDFYFKREE